MISQLTRTLAELISPIAASQNKTTQSTQSDADRDAMGNAYENLHQGQQNAQEKSPEEQAEQKAESPEKPTAQVIPLSENTPEELLTARKKAIGVSQAWMGLVTALEKQKSNIGEQVGQWFGNGAYEKANTGTSKAACAKKGVIVDKKAA